MPILDGRSDDADALMRTPSTDAGAVRSAVSAARAEAPSTGTAATSSPSVGSSRASGPSSADSGSGASSSSCGASSTGWAVCDVASSSAVCASVSAFSVGAAAGASGCAQAALGASDSASTAAIRSDSSFLGISAPPEPARASFEPMIIGTSLPGPRGTMGRCSDFASSETGRRCRAPSSLRSSAFTVTGIARDSHPHSPQAALSAARRRARRAPS